MRENYTLDDFLLGRFFPDRTKQKSFNWLVHIGQKAIYDSKMSYDAGIYVEAKDEFCKLLLKKLVSD